jgi:hypothetical protein
MHRVGRSPTRVPDARAATLRLTPRAERP